LLFPETAPVVQCPATPPAKKRVRLAPAVRKQLILEAALAEFSTQGFGATSTERIARRAGLSQAGLYAHFPSKDAILEALFNELLRPEWPQWLPADAPFDDAAVDRLIDCWYARAGDPVLLSILRLLVAEGNRHPELLQRWRLNVMQPFFQLEQRMIDTLSAHGHVNRCVLSEHFQLATSPIAHVMLLHMIQGGACGGFADDIATMREAHRRMLKQFLVPAAGR
jgi:AcrR family transcriptional regulator